MKKIKINLKEKFYDDDFDKYLVKIIRKLKRINNREEK